MDEAQIKVGTCRPHYGGREQKFVDLRIGTGACGAQNGKTKIQIETGLRMLGVGFRLELGLVDFRIYTSRTLWNSG